MLLDSWVAGTCSLCLAFRVQPCSSRWWVPAKWPCWWAGCQCCSVPWGTCLEPLLSGGSAASLSGEWLVRLPLIWTICGNLHALLELCFYVRPPVREQETSMGIKVENPRKTHCSARTIKWKIIMLIVNCTSRTRPIVVFILSAAVTWKWQNIKQGWNASVVVPVFVKGLPSLGWSSIGLCASLYRCLLKDPFRQSETC